MPAFTFEKLSAPTSREPATPPKKQRSTLGQFLGRLVQSRTKRSQRRDQSSPGPQTKIPQ